MENKNDENRERIINYLNIIGIENPNDEDIQLVIDSLLPLPNSDIEEPSYIETLKSFFNIEPELKECILPQNIQYDRYPQKNDGSCLFYSLSFLLANILNPAIIIDSTALRNTIVEYMEKNKDELIKLNWIKNEIHADNEIKQFDKSTVEQKFDKHTVEQKIDKLTVEQKFDKHTVEQKIDKLTVEQKFVKRISDMKNPTTYGSTIEVYCASRIYKCKIVILILDYNKTNLIQYNGSEHEINDDYKLSNEIIYTKTNKILYLYNCTYNTERVEFPRHFEALIPKNSQEDEEKEKAKKNLYMTITDEKNIDFDLIYLTDSFIQIIKSDEQKDNIKKETKLNIVFFNSKYTLSEIYLIEKILEEGFLIGNIIMVNKLYYNTPQRLVDIKNKLFIFYNINLELFADSNSYNTYVNTNNLKIHFSIKIENNELINYCTAPVNLSFDNNKLIDFNLKTDCRIWISCTDAKQLYERIKASTSPNYDIYPPVDIIVNSKFSIPGKNRIRKLLSFRGKIVKIIPNNDRNHQFQITYNKSIINKINSFTITRPFIQNIISKLKKQNIFEFKNLCIYS